MGRRVFRCQHKNKHLRVYGHEHPSGDGLTLMIINMKPQGIRVTTDINGTPSQTYTLSAKRLTSRKVFINGVRPRLKRPLTPDNFPANTEPGRVPAIVLAFGVTRRAVNIRATKQRNHLYQFRLSALNADNSQGRMASKIPICVRSARGRRASCRFISSASSVSCSNFCCKCAMDDGVNEPRR